MRIARLRILINKNKMNKKLFRSRINLLMIKKGKTKEITKMLQKHNKQIKSSKHLVLTLDIRKTRYWKNWFRTKEKKSKELSFNASDGWLTMKLCDLICFYFLIVIFCCKSVSFYVSTKIFNLFYLNQNWNTLKRITLLFN